MKEAKTEGNMVKLRVEPSKGGDEETLEADIVLLSAGERLLSVTLQHVRQLVMWEVVATLIVTR